MQRLVYAVNSEADCVGMEYKVRSLRGARLVTLLVAGVCLANGQSVDPIENYLSSAQEKANNVVYNGGAAGSRIAMEAGQALLNAIGSFRAAYADSLKLTERSLTGQQLTLFRNIRATTELLEGSLDRQSDKLQGITNTLDQAVRDLPFGSEMPRVMRVTPLYTVDGSTQEFVIHGLGLANGDPILDVVGGAKIRPNTKTDAELRFSFPSHGAVANRPLLYATTLHVFERRKQYFGLWNEYVDRTYQIRLAIYPREVGQYTITPRRRVAVTETEAVTTPAYRCESPHGEGSSTVPVSIAPKPGWIINVSSIRYNRSYSNNGSFTMNTTAATGFTATLSCSGFGKRTGPFGVVVDDGNQGVEQGTFSYTQTREGTTLRDAESKTLALRWGDSLTVSDLPADTETVICRLNPFTGQQLDVEGTGGNRFLQLEFNSVSKVVTIRARAIEEALRSS